jgi:hypothetical protein
MSFYSHHGVFNKYLAVSGERNIANSLVENGEWLDNGHKGVFALLDIPRGTLLCPYVGDIYREEECVLVDWSSAYLMEVHKKCYIDGQAELYDIGYMSSSPLGLDSTCRCAPNYGRYVNTIHPGLSSQVASHNFNVSIVGECDGFEEIWLESTVDIKAGSELLMCYGPSYLYDRHCGASPSHVLIDLT